VLSNDRILGLELTPFCYLRLFVITHIPPSSITHRFEQALSSSFPPSESHNCLRFALWLTLHTIKDFIFTYLVSYLLRIIHG